MEEMIPQEIETMALRGRTHHLSPSHQEPIQLRTAKSLRVLAGALMERHGCLVEEGRLTLPVGSTRTLRRPYLKTMTFWYDIVLPDQYHLLEAYHPLQELSILFW